MSDPGQPPELAWLPIDRLDADGSYQRSVDGENSQRMIARIAKGFRWARFGAVLAVKSGDRWQVIDGQHRVRACQLRGGISHVPAVVLPHTDAAEAAADFVAINRDRIAMTPMSLHRARLAAGDPAATRVEAICRAAGITICTHPIPANHIKPRHTLAVGAIYAIVNRHGAAVAESTLRVLAEAYADKPGCVRAPYLNAVAEILHARELRADRVVAVLSATPQPDLTAAAQRIRSVDGGSLTVHIADIIRRRAARGRRAA